MKSGNQVAYPIGFQGGLIDAKYLCFSDDKSSAEPVPDCLFESIQQDGHRWLFREGVSRNLVFHYSEHHSDYRCTTSQDVSNTQAYCEVAQPFLWIACCRTISELPLSGLFRVVNQVWDT